MRLVSLGAVISNICRNHFLNDFCYDRISRRFNENNITEWALFYPNAYAWYYTATNVKQYKICFLVYKRTCRHFAALFLCFALNDLMP